MSRIAVYTIALNEEKHVHRWAQSNADADYRFILDTGSEDGTVSLALREGIDVLPAIISPWRFDDARNTALALLPDDVDFCISLDMDEVLVPGWRNVVEQALEEGATEMRALIRAGQEWMVNRGHARIGYRWQNLCHELIASSGGITRTTEKTFTIEHLPDRSKPRTQYLSLLEKAYAEDPTPRNCFYLAREYGYRKMHDEQKKHALLFLSMRGASANERADAMLWLAKLVPTEMEQWLFRACGEAPWRREPWVALAQARHDEKDWEGCLAASLRALSMEDKFLHYFCDPSSWGSRPYDLAALSYWHLGLKDKAAVYGAKAVELEPKNQRLARNLKWYTGERSEQRNSKEPF